MSPYLEQVANILYNNYNTAISNVTFVFPNRRSGLFFRKYLSQAAGKPLFAPDILTINELFFRLSGKKPADRIGMLFLLYRIYIRYSNSDESFDDFVYWGEMLLNDFDDIDKYLVNAFQLFSNISDLRNIEREFNYLQPWQIEAIRSFWSSFKPHMEDNSQKSFLEIWKLLYPVYTEFKNSLSQEKKGYEGMIAREVVERLKKDDNFLWEYKKIIFVGLNAISLVEKELLFQLKKRGIADFYWDDASDKVRDPDNKASFFIKELSLQFPSKIPLPDKPLTTPKIRLIGIPSRVGQAKYVHTLLEESLGGRTEMEPEEALRTAVVLTDEQLLIPVLNSIPEAIKPINITLGYPLTNTPIAAFMESVLTLQRNIRLMDGEVFFYNREVMSVLKHPYILSFCPDITYKLLKEITDNNKTYVAQNTLSLNILLSTVFSPVNEVTSVSDYLLTILKELNKTISTHHTENEDGERVSTNELEQEFIYHYYLTVNRMNDLIKQSGIVMSIDTYYRLLKRLIDTITIPFHGEPLSGLQIMGVLETRVLDFDKLIILSMNEGIFPVKNVANSFIPYNLRRGFGLPTYEHQDSVWAYHFYRLITRAKEVILLYDTRNDGYQTGEVSRFISQLKYHYKQTFNEQLLVYNIASAKPVELFIEKNDKIIQELNLFQEGGNKAFSASSINTYLDCPLKFYFSSIKDLREENELNDNIESSLFGSILHRVLEILYKSFTGGNITADLLKLKSKESTVTEAIQRAFAELYYHTKNIRSLSGQSYLTGEMIRKYIIKLLELDRKLTPFRYIQSEKKLMQIFHLSNGMKIQLKGFIDRVDEINGIMRIVDYKTGIKKPLDFISIGSLFNKANEKRSQAIMQVFMYAWMYDNEKFSKNPLQPVIYYMRDLFSDEFDPAIYFGKEKQAINDFRLYKDEFQINLRNCMDEIFDPSFPFIQTENTKICSYCSFISICGNR